MVENDCCPLLPRRQSEFGERMKIIGKFTEDAQHVSLSVNGQEYKAIWEDDPGFVDLPGLTEIKARIDDKAGDPVLIMRWLIADITIAGGKQGVLEALESFSHEGSDWAECMRMNRDNCPPSVMRAGAIGLLSLIASPPASQGHGLGTPLARAFAETVLTRHGVRSFWIKPVPLVEHPATGFFKPEHDIDSPAFSTASERLELHYERSLDAEWTCPDYLRVDLVPPLL
jgi:hypothetical protein